MTKKEITGKRSDSLLVWAKNVNELTSSDVSFIIWNYKSRDIALLDVNKKNDARASPDKDIILRIFDYCIKKAFCPLHRYTYSGLFKIEMNSNILANGFTVNGCPSTVASLIEQLSFGFPCSQERFFEYDSPMNFSRFIRHCLPDSKTGYCVSDVDLVLSNPETKKFAIIESKAIKEENQKSFLQRYKTQFQYCMWTNVSRSLETYNAFCGFYILLTSDESLEGEWRLYKIGKDDFRSLDKDSAQSFFCDLLS